MIPSIPKLTVISAALIPLGLGIAPIGQGFHLGVSRS